MVRILLCVVGLVATCLAQAPTTQGRFLDDAGRSVALPSRVSRVFAAGAPAEVMVYTLAPDLLVGDVRAFFRSLR